MDQKRTKRFEKSLEWKIDKRWCERERERERKALNKQQREHVVNHFVGQPQIWISNIVDSLKTAFEDFRKVTSVRKYTTSECHLSFKRGTFWLLAGNNESRLNRWFEWVKKWTMTDVNYLTNSKFIDKTESSINRWILSFMAYSNYGSCCHHSCKERYLAYYSQQ